MTLGDLSFPLFFSFRAVIFVDVAVTCWLLVTFLVYIICLFFCMDTFYVCLSYFNSFRPALCPFFFARVHLNLCIFNLDFEIGTWWFNDTKYARSVSYYLNCYFLQSVDDRHVWRKLKLTFLPSTHFFPSISKSHARAASKNFLSSSFSFTSSLT